MNDPFSNAHNLERMVIAMLPSMYLERPHINDELRHIFDQPLFLISAPAGYGKTMAVSQFLRKQKVKTLWINSDKEDSKQSFWRKLTEQISALEENVGKQLQDLGFPKDSYELDRIVDILLSLEIRKPVVVVFDNYQDNMDLKTSALIKLIIKKRIENLHIIIITRELGKIDFWDYYHNQLCYLMSAKALEFTENEIADYAKLLNVEIDEDTIKKIYQYTEGWISMIYLMLKNISPGIEIGRNATIDELIERNIYSALTASDKRAWLMLSYLDNFSMQLASHLLDGYGDADMLNQIFHDNALLTFNSFTKTFTIHSIFRDFLQEKSLLEKFDPTEVYSKAGHWYLEKGSFADACDYLLKAGEVEIILSEMNKENIPDIHFSQFKQIYKIFEGLNDDLWKKYPLAYLQYMRTHLISGDIRIKQRSARLLKRMEDYFSSADFEEHYKNFILGEIYIIWPFVAFNDCEKMVMYNKIAEKYLDGNCSCIVTRKKEVTFGSPHLLYLYFREPGKLKETTELIVNNFFRFALVADGCGTGCDSVAQAEYNLETGDFDNVELFAYKAIYKARADEQLGVVVCASFTIMRYMIYMGNFKECKQLFSTLKSEVEMENNPVLNTAFDMCNAYIGCCLRDGESLPKWLKEGELTYGNFMFPGVAFNYLVHEKCLLLIGEYLKLDALCEMFSNYITQYNNQMAVLHNAIHEAIAKHKLQDLEIGKKYMRRALDIGEADLIVMPFVENAEYILEILLSIKEDGSFANEEYLDKLIMHCRKYEESIASFSIHKEVLSAREMEILRLIAQGDKHSEIGEKLFISTTTVRFHIKNIYNKLEVNNKVAMLRKAESLSLI